MSSKMIKRKELLCNMECGKVWKMYNMHYIGFIGCQVFPESKRLKKKKINKKGRGGGKLRSIEPICLGNFLFMLLLLFLVVDFGHMCKPFFLPTSF